MARTGDRAHHAAAPAAEPGARHAHRRAHPRGRGLRSGQLPQQRHGAGGPEVIARLAPAGGLDQIVAGFGSAWMADTDTQTLLRMDPATRRVTARFPLRRPHGASRPAGARCGSASRRTSAFRLLRIDPRTNRIVARLRTPDVPGGSSVQRAGDRRRQPLAPERRGGRADRPARRSRPRDGAHRAQRVPDALARGGRRRPVGADQRRPRRCGSTAPPAGARPPSTCPTATSSATSG